MPKYLITAYYNNGKSVQVGGFIDDYVEARKKAKNLAQNLKNLKGIIIFRNYGEHGSSVRTNRVVEAFTKDRSWHP